MNARYLLLLLSITPFVVLADVIPDLSALTIRNPDDAAQQRTRLTQLVFGSSQLPSVSPQVNGNQLFYPLPDGYGSTAYLHRPTQPNQELLIYQHGHFNDAEIAEIEQAVLTRFLPAGFTVLFVNMPLYGPNRDARYPNPSNHDEFYPQTPGAIAHFLEPSVAFVNQLAPNYSRISMMGLSGGGWTTVMYAALDTRIARSYPVAGSYPQYIVRQLPMTYGPDAEQTDSAIYSNIDYLDFYTIAAMKHQLQIYNYNDACCFQGDYSKQYEGAIANIVHPYGGNFSVYVDDNNQHSISDRTYALILNDLRNLQTPFKGVPTVIPGTIEAENFDFGAEAVAYHDVDSNNWRGNVYRASAVEVAPTTDAGGGYNVGYTRAGEWLEYTVDVPTAGAYRVEVRVASDGAGGTFHLEFNGTDKTGTLTIPDTGGWQNWQTLTKSNVMLDAGTQVLRLMQDANGPTGSIGNINWVRFTAEASSGQAPYLGTPFSIPGTIQAEDFDNGGEGVAYHDVDPENWRGNVYRTSAVEVAATSDIGGGYNVGYTRASEWLEYTLNVAQAGTYTLEVRVASDGVGGTIHFEVDGIDATGPMSIPNTGGWQNWTTLSRTVQLNAGTHVLRLMQDANGASGSIGNINWIRFSAPTAAPQTPYGGIAWSLPGTIQAEDFDNGGEGVAYHDVEPENLRGNVYRTSAVEVAATSDVGGGYNLGYTRPGEWLEYSVQVDAAQTYRLEVRVASEGQGGTFHIEFNGVDRTGPIAVPNTGAWQNWTTVSRDISVEAGAQVVRLVLDSAGSSGSIGNINWFRLTTASGHAIPGTIQAEDFDDGGEGVAYHDTDTSNNGGAYRSTAVDIQATQDAGGGYDVGWTRPGEWLRYTVNVAVAGYYTFDVRVASDGAGGTFHVEIDGADWSGAITVPNTGGWQNWTTVTRTGLYLPAGSHTLRLVQDSGGPTSGSVGNINWMRFTAAP